MSFIKYRIKILEGFKDGNVLGGMELKANQIIDVDEGVTERIRQSGGRVEVLQSLVPNPKKQEIIEPVEVVEAVEAEPKKVSGKKNDKK
jgi:hypothetical protein